MIASSYENIQCESNIQYRRQIMGNIIEYFLLINSTQMNSFRFFFCDTVNRYRLNHIHTHNRTVQNPSNHVELL